MRLVFSIFLLYVSLFIYFFLLLSPKSLTFRFLFLFFCFFFVFFFIINRCVEKRVQERNVASIRIEGFRIMSLVRLKLAACQYAILSYPIG